MEFQLVPTIENGIVKTNAAELLQTIEPALKKYNYLVTEENYSQAKTDRAKLNNLAKTVTAERKKIEDDVFGEWKKEKKSIMDLEKTLKAYADGLGEGIKSLDDSEKEIKKAQIKEFWETLTKLYPFDLVFDSKMVNKGTKTKDVEKYLKETLEKARQNELVMETFIPEDAFEAQQVRNVFYSTMDLAQAKAKADELARLHMQVEAEEKASLPEIPKEEVPEMPEFKEPKDEPTYFATFTVSGNYDTMSRFSQQLASLINKYGIEAKVDKKWSV